MVENVKSKGLTALLFFPEIDYSKLNGVVA